MENEEQIQNKPKKKKFLKKFFRGIIVFLAFNAVLLLILGVIFPGLLWRKDLGVKYTKADYDSIMSKLSYMKDEAPKGDLSSYTYKYGALQDVDVIFTSSEITAFFNYNRPTEYPLNDVQIRVNNDGTIDAVAVADVDYFLNEFMSSKYSKDQINNSIPLLGILPNKVNLEIKFSGSVLDNKSNINLIDAKVQGVSVPKDYINTSEAISVITSGTDKIMDKFSSKTGSKFKSISVVDEAIKFIGSVPSSLERVKND